MNDFIIVKAYLNCKSWYLTRWCLLGNTYNFIKKAVKISYSNIYLV